MSYAPARPWALTTLFVYRPRQRLPGGVPRSRSDLFRLVVGHWAGPATSHQEARSQREVTLLGEVLSLLGRKRDQEASELIEEQVQEIIHAEQAGSPWAKSGLTGRRLSASASSTALPDGALAL